MGKFFVQMVDAFSGDVIESYDDDDELFDSYEDAEWEAMESSNSFATGAEVLELAGEDFTDPDSAEFVVAELDD